MDEMMFHSYNRIGTVATLCLAILVLITAVLGYLSLSIIFLVAMLVVLLLLHLSGRHMRLVRHQEP